MGHWVYHSSPHLFTQSMLINTTNFPGMLLGSATWKKNWWNHTKPGLKMTGPEANCNPRLKSWENKMSKMNGKITSEQRLQAQELWEYTQLVPEMKKYPQKLDWSTKELVMRQGWARLSVGEVKSHVHCNSKSVPSGRGFLIWNTFWKISEFFITFISRNWE